MFKPQLLPNEPAGEAPDWEARLNPIQDYLVSVKYDGARVEIPYEGSVLGRSLKRAPNIQVQEMGADFRDALGRYAGVFEGEFFSPEMTFSEIMHFWKTEDVFSDKTRRKYDKLWEKTKGGEVELGWNYPGRDPSWLCTWHDSLQFYIFDYYVPETEHTKLERYHIYRRALADIYRETSAVVTIPQFQLNHVDAFYQAYDQALLDGNEGLVIIRKDQKYKKGRITLKSGDAYKAKENQLEFDGQIIEVQEGTYAREGSVKTVNELGRSRTSQMKEDRVPGGFCKGFKVRMEDGRELTVQLNGYSHPEKEQLLRDSSQYIGQWIRFTGMKPVKPGGVPRIAQYTKGNMRDSK